MESKGDPGLKQFFVRILNCVSWGLIWLLAVATAGIYYKLAFVGATPVWAVVLFYLLALVSLYLLLRYIIKNWK